MSPPRTSALARRSLRDLQKARMLWLLKEQVFLFSTPSLNYFSLSFITRKANLWRAPPPGLNSKGVPFSPLTPAVGHPILSNPHSPFADSSFLSSLFAHHWLPQASLDRWTWSSPYTCLITLSPCCSTPRAPDAPLAPLPSHVNITEHPQASGQKKRWTTANLSQTPLIERFLFNPWACLRVLCPSSDCSPWAWNCLASLVGAVKL